ncbi:hypothetical protein AHAS_Ahas14G0235300 [Arachis hypogaea]
MAMTTLPPPSSPNRRSFLSIAANSLPPSPYSSSLPPTFSTSTSPCPPLSSTASNSHTPSLIIASSSKDPSFHYYVIIFIDLFESN